MVNKASLLISLFIVLFSLNAYGQKTATLKLCAQMDKKPFVLFTGNAQIGEPLGFKKYKETDLLVRDFRVIVDDAQTTYFKPVDKSENCVTVYKIKPGKSSVYLDFKSVSYTAIETKTAVTLNFKPDMLHTANIEIVEGAVATVVMNQSSDKVMVYQSLSNEEIRGCEKKCQVPEGIPVYFVMKSQDEKVKCPVKFELIVGSEHEKNLNCYDSERIQKALSDFVENQNILCLANVEYAFFKVYGEGCLFFPEMDDEGLNYKAPELKLLPLDKQKYKYFWKINSEEKKNYIFSGDRKGMERVPAEGDIIEFIEERNF
ncbi:MAG: hypothetical protein ACOX2F_01015 [bacterium]